jgi:hypothetical protein
VKSRSPEHWSLFRSLAFLAATFAVMFGALLPSAAAAGAGDGTPVMLCSGQQVLVTFDDDGTPRPEKPASMDGGTCTDCVLAAFTALPPPPPPAHPTAPPRIVSVRPVMVRPGPPPVPVRVGLPPPSTAPPLA